MFKSLSADQPETRRVFLEFLTPRKWTVNVHRTFYGHIKIISFSKALTTHRIALRATENPFVYASVPLYSAKVTVWCGLTTSFIERPFFSRPWIQLVPFLLSEIITM